MGNSLNSIKFIALIYIVFPKYKMVVDDHGERKRAHEMIKDDSEEVLHKMRMTVGRG